MRKVLVVVFVLAASVVAAQTIGGEMSRLHGTWRVTDCYVLTSSFIVAFYPDTAASRLTAFTFRADGTATLTFADGMVTQAFFGDQRYIDSDRYTSMVYLQPQGFNSLHWHYVQDGDRIIIRYIGLNARSGALVVAVREGE